MRPLLVILFTLIVASCDSGNSREQGIESSQFSSCNQQLQACFQGSGDYCLFGYKWGASNPFTPVGFDVAGPETEAQSISYSFQNTSPELNTHRQLDVVTHPFDDLMSCARTQTQRALNTWAQVANISFIEEPDNSDSDIRFFAADILQSGIGYPNYTDNTCSTFSGNVILKPSSRFNTCESFYLFVLHETGHALGLGHVDTPNIMNTAHFDAATGLGAGDIAGIQAIYGPQD